MISRRSFVTTSLVTAAASTIPSTKNSNIEAQQPSIDATASSSKKTASGPGSTAHKLVIQKAKKLIANPNYKAFESGELATSCRFVFEGMQRSGMTTQLQKYIKSNGAAPLTNDFLAANLQLLAEQGAVFPPNLQQSISKTLTHNATAAAQAYTNLVNKHGLSVVHSGLHDLMRRVSSSSKSHAQQTELHQEQSATLMPAVLHIDREPPLIISDMGEIVGGKPTNPKLVFASLGPLLDTGDQIEPMDVTNPTVPGDGDGGEGDGDGGGGDGGGGDGGGGDGGGGDGDGDGSPGTTGDPDTSESANGTIVYEGLTEVTAASACTVLNSVIAFGAGLSSAAIAAWAETNPAAAAAFAASLGFASVGVLVAFLVGIGAITTYYAVFC